MHRVLFYFNVEEQESKDLVSRIALIETGHCGEM